MTKFGHDRPVEDGWGVGQRKVVAEEQVNCMTAVPTWEEFSATLKTYKKKKAMKKDDISGYVVAQSSEWLQRYLFDVVVWIWENPESGKKMVV